MYKRKFKKFFCTLCGLLLFFPVIQSFAQDTLGDAWLVPSTINLTKKSVFTTELHINTGTIRSAAWGYVLTYDPAILSFTMVEKVGDFFLTVNGSEPGVLRFSAFAMDGLAASSDLHHVNIQWQALDTGSTSIEFADGLLLSDSSNARFQNAGIPLALEIKDFLQGDVDGSGTVNIIDALMTARYTVGFTAVNFNPIVADVDGNGVINIVDALMIAQYFVGILLEFPAYIPLPQPLGTPFPEPVIITIVLKVEGGGEGAVYPHLQSGSKMDETFRGPEGSLAEYVFDAPDVLEIIPYINNFTHWGGDIVSSDTFLSFKVEESLLIEVYFVDNATPTPPPTPTPTPSPEPTPTPEPTPIQGVGEVWYSPASLTVRPGSSFNTTLHVNVGQEHFAAYGFDILYDSTLMTPDNSRGDAGVVAGADGFLSVVNDDDPGILTVAGFDATGTGPGVNLAALELFWLAGEAEGTADLGLIINVLSNEAGADIGEPLAGGATILISTTRESTNPGDADGDANINIVDALMAAQYYVGLNPAGISAGNLDVNNDGTVNIIDALMIAQYSVGLITHF